MAGMVPVFISLPLLPLPVQIRALAVILESALQTVGSDTRGALGSEMKG